MIALISPAKSLDFEQASTTKESSEIIFNQDVTYLVDKLKKKSPRQLKKMMGISDNLAELNAMRYQTNSVIFLEIL